MTMSTAAEMTTEQIVGKTYIQRHYGHRVGDRIRLTEYVQWVQVAVVAAIRRTGETYGEVTVEGTRYSYTFNEGWFS